MVTLSIIIVSLIIAGAIIGYAIKKTSKKSSQDREPVDTLHIVGGTTAHKSSGSHGDDHGHGHGGWTRGDWIIVASILGAVAVICFVIWVPNSKPEAAHTASRGAGQPAAVVYEAPPVDPSCIMTKQPQFCHVGAGGQALVLDSHLHSGMTICITPGIDERKLPEEQRIYKSVTTILRSGASHPYDPTHLETNSVIGYMLEPKKAIIVHQFVAESPDAVGC